MFIEEEWSSDVDLKERPAGTEEKKLGSRRVSFEEAVSSLGEAMGTHDVFSKFLSPFWFSRIYKGESFTRILEERRLCQCECKERKL